MAYYTEVLADSPLVLLKLDETSGTSAADSGSRATAGTYVNGVLLNQAGLSVQAAAAQFDGGDDYVEIADAADLDITGDLTLEALIYPTSYGNYRMLWTKASGAIGPYQWYLESGTGLPVFYHHSSFIAMGTAAPALNAWSHIAVVRSGTTATHYLNGASNGSGNVSSAPSASADPLRFGRRSEANYYFAGKAAGLAVYNSALSGARIAAHAGELTGGVARITQAPALVVETPSPLARVTQASVLVVETPSPQARVTQAPVMVVYGETGGGGGGGARSQVVVIG